MGKSRSGRAKCNERDYTRGGGLCGRVILQSRPRILRRGENPPSARFLWHTGSMARGWESKSVEAQKDIAESRQPPAAAARLTPEQRRRLQERESLELSRRRILRELALATHPRRRESLEAALRHLEEKLAALD